MSSKKEENIAYQLVNIEILETEMKAPKKALPQNFIFSFDIALEQRINIEKDFIFVICNITIFPQNKSEEKLGKFSSSCIFKVNDLSKYITEDKKINLSKNFIDSLSSVSISTTRGLMFSLFKGTFLQRAILPLLNTNQHKAKKII